MKTTIMIALLIASTQADAAIAMWTGRMEQFQTVTYQWMWKCEYDYFGDKFYFLFRNSCPATVNVQ